MLALHKKGLKKINKISESEFAEIATMLDEEEEPEGTALRSAYWNIKTILAGAPSRNVHR